MFEFIGWLLALAISVAISIAISQPFTGALVRLRANYLPKAVSLDNVLEDGAAASSSTLGGGSSSGVSPRAISAYFLREGRQTAKIGPVVNGVVAMLTRTKRLEGWAGLYKGSVPVALQLCLISSFTSLLYGAGVRTGGGYRAAPASPDEFGLFTNLVFMLLVATVALPLNVVTYRAIVHPRLLSWSRPRENLHELLSYSEYAQPWRLFLLPGLLASTFAHVAWIGLATRLVRHVLVPTLGGLEPAVPAGPNDTTYSGPSSGSLEVSTFGLALFLAWNVFSVVVLSPLEVISVRLATQRPERQQPLHVAFARTQQQQRQASSRPNPYSHHAQTNVAAGAAAGADSTVSGGYSDRANGGGGKPNASAEEEPLASRPSFAIDDDDDDEEAAAAANGRGAKSTTSAPATGALGGDAGGEPAAAAASAAGSKDLPQPPPRGAADDLPPSRVFGGAAPAGTDAYTSATASFGAASPSLHEPSEPVIALRPCDVPLTPSAAAQAEAEGFGAPVVERYDSLSDCLQKLVDEEGVEALYRGAWVTMLGALVGSFAY